MVGGGEKKQEYFTKLVKLLDEYPKILIVSADNVGSTQMQKIRQALRGMKSVILMGKNTMIRKAIRGHIQNNPALEELLTHVKGNIGFVFVKDDLAAARKILLEHKVSAPAKTGSISPCDVTVPAGNTGMEPTQTSFLQALNIPSKINKGQIEITVDVLLIKEGAKVGSSESTLLQKLNIKPFKYGLIIRMVYDHGSIYEPKFLDVKDEDVIAKFRSGVTNIACLSLATGLPTIASLPHNVLSGYKNLLAIAVATNYTFPKAEKVKQYLANPGAFAAAAPTAAPAAAPAKDAPKGGKKEEPKKEEKKESEEEIGAFGLFDE